jgi:DNA-binding MarR family transcriptional regulator
MGSNDPTKVRRAQGGEDLGIVDGLVQLSFLVQAVLSRVAADGGLSIIQTRLLGVLRDREPGMAQLARFLRLDKSSTSGLVDRAERRGLVRRTTVPEDGRAVHVVLTPAGRMLVEAYAAEVRDQILAAVETLSETNRKRLSQLATQVVIDDAVALGLDLSAGRLGAEG